MKKIIPFIIAIALVAGGFYYFEVSSPMKDVMHMIDQEAYCLEQDGEIVLEVRDGKEFKVCAINDGQDGIRCRLDLFAKKECGHQKQSSQRAFLEARGNPDIFMIMFSEAKLDESGQPVLRDEPLRAETWTFASPDNVVSTFENGFYVGEEPTSMDVSLPEHDISPLDFSLKTTQQDVMGMMGEADCVVTAEAGPHTITTLNYEAKNGQPGGSLSFSDKQIIAVNVGIGFSEDGENICPN